MSGPRHFLDLDRFETAELRRMLDLGAACKRGAAPRGTSGDPARPLAGKALAMIFEKPSTRTRISFERGIRQLGGDALVLEPSSSQLGRGETVADTARVLSRYVDAIVLRTTSEEKLLEMAENATVPVINGLTNRTHPCQLMADVMTFEEHKGPIEGKSIVWTGDGNNMAKTWIHGAARFGYRLKLACPDQLCPPEQLVEWARAEGAEVSVGADPEAAVDGADCVIADTWVSMGDDAGDRQDHGADLSGLTGQSAQGFGPPQSNDEHQNGE